MRRTISIAVSSANPSAMDLADRFFQDGQRQEKILVFFSVTENPFDPRLGALLPFFILSMERKGGTQFKLRGSVVDPAGRESTGKSFPAGFHKATVEYDIASRSGTIRIRG